MWPLFHSRGLPQEDGLDAYVNFQSQFDAYIKTNKMFADVIEENYQKGDVWCHDYHLMFLPRLLKEKRPNMRVGWFLHTPFPSSETFHTYDYARNFVSVCTHILGLQGTLVGVQDQGRYPIRIDSQRFVQTVQVLDVQNRIKELKGRFGGKKGIPKKLRAFEKFLKDNSNWCDKAVLVQIAMPTRTEVPMYKKLARHVHEIVGQISGRFGTPTLLPVHFFDVALITSVMDGINLASYEFVACQAFKERSFSSK
ncbi:putative alpha,alpha-trehalose-phosphate synthase (UDP-forming) [Helianthus annuus]|nr:putative alpha,alpha-trehalose-phosphate synthase (UDP-forming) [Helianthus annuus]